jgi:hypothetical protein
VDVTEKRGRPVNLKTYKLQSAYSERLPLPENKIKDLKELMKNGSIPNKYHSYYLDLIAVGTKTTQECEEGCEDCMVTDDVNV